MRTTDYSEHSITFQFAVCRINRLNLMGPAWSTPLRVEVLPEPGIAAGVSDPSPRVAKMIGAPVDAPQF